MPEQGANVPKATFHILLYGHYAELAQRCIESVRRFVPRDEYLLRIGLNACCRETLQYVDSVSQDLPIDLIVRSHRNIHKYPMMRKLFWDKPIETEWVVWFDDDTYILSDAWWKGVWQRLKDEPAEALGQLWWWIFLPGEWEFIQKRPWFRGRPPENGRRSPSPAARFMTGSYWVMKTECIRALDWPDPQLVAQGGDTLLGAAIWQQQWRQIHFDAGIKVNDAPRRTATMPRIGVESAGSDASDRRTPADLRTRLPDWTTIFAEHRHLNALKSRLEEKTDWLQQQLCDTIHLLRAVLLNLSDLSDPSDPSEAQRQIQQAWLRDPKLQRGLALCVTEQDEGDGETSQPPIEVDCAGRVNHCKAVCCKMPRALAREEVFEGRLHWSVEEPFLLPRDSDGYCAYLNRETFQCAVHEYKPVACRAYTCERDREIWEDFWAKIPGPLLRPSH